MWLEVELAKQVSQFAEVDESKRDSVAVPHAANVRTFAIANATNVLLEELEFVADKRHFDAVVSCE